WPLRVKQLAIHSAQLIVEDVHLQMAIDVVCWEFIKQVIIPLPGLVQCFVTFLLEVMNFFKLLSGLGWWTVPLDKGFFKEIPGIDGVFHNSRMNWLLITKFTLPSISSLTMPSAWFPRVNARNAFHENFTKIIEVQYAWKPPCCTHCKVFGHEEKRCKLNKKDKIKERIVNGNETVDNAFKVVQNRKVNKETNQAECNKNGNIELEKNYNGKGILENKKVGQNEKGDSTKTTSKNEIGLRSYNRFTLLESLVNEEELVPSIEQRKVVDEVLRRKIDASDSDMNGWNEETKRYYKDRKELFDVAAELERDEDIIDGHSEEEEYVIRNERDLGTQKVIARTKSLTNPNCRTLKKLDRIMINEAFPGQIPTCTWKAFRFSNSITEKKEFLPIVKEEWEKDIEGYMMYRVVKKMKLLKPKLNPLSWKNGNVFERVINLRNKLKDDQAEDFLGKQDKVTKFLVNSVVFPNKLANEQAIDMVKPVSEAEVKNAMFDIEDSKAPGPDRFTARFYKSAWIIVGKEVCKAIQEIFETGKLLGGELFRGYNRKQKTKKVSFKIDL
ncbi:hypothetical protein Tco_1234222, partial [Tanacetum coccineum]